MQESYTWIAAIIDSVKHPFQLECCHTFINLFRQKYTLEDGFGQCYDELLSKIEMKGTSLKV